MLDKSFDEHGEPCYKFNPNSKAVHDMLKNLPYSWRRVYPPLLRAAEFSWDNLSLLIKRQPAKIELVEISDWARDYL